MALTTDQLRHLSHLYDRWQSGDVIAREVVQHEVDANSADVARAFALMVARVDTEVSATLLPPIPKALRDAAVLAVGQSDSGVLRDDGALNRSSSAAGFSKALSDAIPTREPGQHVGPYRLIKELGRGGMGVVWLAERADGQHHRQVALKMPLVENLNWLLAARFARERNILASLEHPGIARLYDAGVDQTTQPYIALEYVAGFPITTYVREHKLKPEAIVLLFTRVIEAVAHAHAQLVIHRDIKPSNILVDAKGEPHLLDFGIAKLLDDDDTLSADGGDATQLTRLSGRALTLDYASPEQVNGQTLGTASDVYALGVVLYELLTGSRPYQPLGPTRRDLELAILEQEPAKPSDQMLRTGDSESGKSARQMRGDLDTIVLKALRKDAKQRYVSAQAFADDLKRYLAFEPIQARPAGFTYRVTKFIRRQRVPLVIAVVGCAAVVGLTWRTWQQQQLTQASVARAESIDGLMQSIFHGMSPDVAINRNFSAKELLDRARTYLDGDAKISEIVRRRALQRIADLYLEIGANTDAIDIYAREKSFAVADADTRGEALALLKLADANTILRQYEGARAYITQLQAIVAQSIASQDEIRAQLSMVEGRLAQYQDNAPIAMEHYRAAEAQLVAAKSNNQVLRGRALYGQGHTARLLGELRLARERFGAALIAFGGNAGDASVYELSTQSALGEVENALGDFPAALKTLNSVTPILVQRLGSTHTHTLYALRSLAFAQMRMGQFDLTLATLANLRAAPEPYRAAENSYAEILTAMIAMYRGDAAKAEAMLSPVLQLLPPGTVGTARLQRVRGEMLLRADRTREGMRVLSEAEVIQVRLLGEKHPDVAMTRVFLVGARVRAGDDMDGSRSTIRAALELLTRERGVQHPATLIAAAYDELLSGDGGTSSRQRSADLAGRIERELGWQFGAAQLATWLRSGDAARMWRELPIVY